MVYQYGVSLAAIAVAAVVAVCLPSHGENAMAPIAIAYDAVCLGHDVDADHPERPERIGAALHGIEACGLGDKRLLIGPAADAEFWIDEVHPPEHRRNIQRLCASGGGFLEQSTPVSEGTYKAAVAAVGCSIAAVEAVMTGKARRAFCPVRPPGHHSSGVKAMGFCVFNNLAAAAIRARKKHGAKKVLIVDWDAHHGNGTQNIFNKDPSILFFDAHQHPLYPGTGKADDIGEGEAKGTKINVPLPAGSGDKDYLKVFEDRLIPVAIAFKPDLILISAGFDAARRDPLGGMELTDDGFASLTRLVVELADELCQGRVVSILEGGYNLEELTACVKAHVQELARERAGSVKK